jgi:hypothetical protein
MKENAYDSGDTRYAIECNFLYTRTVDIDNRKTKIAKTPGIRLLEVEGK